MKNILILLTEEELKYITGGEKGRAATSNSTFASTEEEQSASSSWLMEHPWLLGGIVACTSIFIVALNLYCCYKMVTSRTVNGREQDRRERENVFLNKYGPI